MIRRGEPAFAPCKRKRRILERNNPPRKHPLAQMTGGYKNILNGQKPSKVMLGEYTSKDGKFVPKTGMPLLIGRYQFVRVLEFGQSACVIFAMDECNDSKPVSIKVMHIQNTTVSYQEADCLVKLNEADTYNASATITLLHTFMFDQHFCMVFDLLQPTPLTNYFKLMKGEEVVLKGIRQVAIRLLVALGFLERENTLHADIKPSNVLLKRANDFYSCTLIDFGNAIKCVEEELSLYYDDYNLVTLLYRPPEVMFGCNFGLPVDMWSLGCVLAELYLKTPIFVGNDKLQIVRKMASILGFVPRHLFYKGMYYDGLQSFTYDIEEQLPATLRLKNYAHINDMNFCSFLAGLFQYDPAKRMTPAEAAKHPFLASELGILYLQPRQPDDQPHYTPVTLTAKDYSARPHVSGPRKSLDSIDLLRSPTSSVVLKPKPRIADVATNILSSMNWETRSDTNNNMNSASHYKETKRKRKRNNTSSTSSIAYSEHYKIKSRK